MSGVVADSVTGSGAGGSTTLTLPGGAPSLGEVLMLYVGCNNSGADATGPVSGQGGVTTWIPIVSSVRRSSQLFYGEVDGTPAAGVTFNNNFRVSTYALLRVQGLDVASLIHGSPIAADDQSNEAATGTFTPTGGAAVFLLAMAAIQNNAQSAIKEAGWTEVMGNGLAGPLAYQDVASASGGYEGSWDTTNAFTVWDAQLVAFNVAGAGGTDVPATGMDAGLATGAASPAATVTAAGIDLALATGPAAVAGGAPASGIDLGLAMGPAAVQVAPASAGLDVGLQLGAATVAAQRAATGVDLQLAIGPAATSVAPIAAGIDLNLELGSASATFPAGAAGLDLALALGPATPAIAIPATGIDLALAMGSAAVDTEGDDAIPATGIDLGLTTGGAHATVVFPALGIDVGLTLGSAGRAIGIPATGLDVGLAAGPAATAVTIAATGIDLDLQTGTPARQIAVQATGIDLGLALGAATIPATQFPLDLCASIAREHRFVIAIACDPQFTASLRSSRC